MASCVKVCAFSYELNYSIHATRYSANEDSVVKGRRRKEICYELQAFYAKLS